MWQVVPNKRAAAGQAVFVPEGREDGSLRAAVFLQAVAAEVFSSSVVLRHNERAVVHVSAVPSECSAAIQPASTGRNAQRPAGAEED